MKLAIVIGSTRPGRIGPVLAQWLLIEANGHPDIEAQIVDLKTIDLPIFDEAAHPRLKNYANKHTEEFSELMGSFDAFVLVTPEYNHNPPSALLNALTFLNEEWSNKPFGLFSYGGISGGLRAAQSLKLMLLAVRGVPVFEGVVAPLAAKQIESEEFIPSEVQSQASLDMFESLVRWNSVLIHLKSHDA